jgi:hypothetical protein
MVPAGQDPCKKKKTGVLACEAGLFKPLQGIFCAVIAAVAPGF